MKVFYSKNYVTSVSRMETVNKSKWMADRLKEEGYSDCIVSPMPLSREELYDTHDKEYINSLYDLKFRGSAAVGGAWDQNLLTSIQYSNGGIRDAVLLAHKEQVAGSLSSGLHHAGTNYGAGFCQVNGLAMGALMAKELGYKVGILDVDAHCGGGTADILHKTDIVIADVSTNRFDEWTYYNPSQKLRIVNHESHYLMEVQNALNYLKAKGCNFIMHNAGMDPSLDGISFTSLAEREKMIADFCYENNMKVVWVLAGGYLSSFYNIDENVLTDLHMNTFHAFNR
jgi:acetoin utilization deacetylase AcuC-like enzyme